MLSGVKPEIIAIFVSSLALIWTSITYYLTYFKRGILKVAFPNLIMINRVDSGKGNLAIAIPLICANKGARLGIVEDFKLILDGQNQIMLIWQTELDSIPPTRKAPLAVPFSVGGYDSVVKLCGFVAESPMDSLEGDNYTVKLMVLTNQTWSESIKFKLYISESTIQNIENGETHAQKNTTRNKFIAPISAHKVKIYTCFA